MTYPYWLVSNDSVSLHVGEDCFISSKLPFAGEGLRQVQLLGPRCVTLNGNTLVTIVTLRPSDLVK